MKNEQSGMVLVIVVLMSALAAILAAALYFASSSQMLGAHREVRLEKAFFIAEAGVERAKSAMRRSRDGFNDELIGGDGITNTADDGILDFGSSVTLAGGAYKVKITDNADSDPSLFKDTDNTVIVWSTGTFQNVERRLEVCVSTPDPLHPPMSADGALALYGTNTTVALQGSALIDGHDYSLPEDFACSGSGCLGAVIATNPSAAGIFSATTSALVTVDGSADITGNPPLEMGGTGDYSEQEWQDLADKYVPLATMTIPGGVISGNQTLGTRENPEIVVLTGDVKITGTVDGAGILIVMGGVDIDFTGTFHFEGIILLIGDGISDAPIEFNDHGNASIFGAVVAVGGELDIKPHGSPQIMYSTEALANLARLPLPPNELSVVYWRQIK